MTQRAVNFVKGENETRQRHGLFAFRKDEPFDFIADGIQSTSVMLLPGLLEIVFPHGTTAVRISTIMLREPAIFSGQGVKMLNEGFVVFGWMRIEQVTSPKD